MSGVAIRPVTPELWGDLADLFGPTGAYGYCWCTYFRRRAKDFTAAVDAPRPERGLGNRELLHRVTEEGRVPGLLAYDDGTPCGWVSLGPRADFVRLAHSRTLRPVDPDEPGVWSLVCFWMPPRRRGKGLATLMLEAAIAHARDNGARVLEAYPVDTAGGRAPTADVHTGTVALMRRAGFTCTRHPASGRPIARLPLTAEAAS